MCVKGNAYFTELRSPFPLLAAASDEDEAALLLPEKEGEWILVGKESRDERLRADRQYRKHFLPIAFNTPSAGTADMKGFTFFVYKQSNKIGWNLAWQASNGSSSNGTYRRKTVKIDYPATNGAYPFVDLPKAYVFCSCGSQSSGETLYLCLVSLRVRLWDGEKVRGVWRYKGHNRFLIRRGLISMGFCPEGRSVFIPSYIQPNNKKR